MCEASAGLIAATCVPRPEDTAAVAWLLAREGAEGKDITVRASEG